MLNVATIRWMLSLTEDERLDILQRFVDSVAEPLASELANR